MSLVEEQQFKRLYSELLSLSLEKGRITSFQDLYSEISTKFLVGSPITQNYTAFPMEEISSRKMRDFFKSLRIDSDTIRLSQEILNQHHFLLAQSVTERIETLKQEVSRLKSRVSGNITNKALLIGDFKSFSTFDRSSDVFFNQTSGEIRSKAWVKVRALKDFKLTTNSKNSIQNSDGELILKFGEEVSFNVTLSSSEVFNYINLSCSNSVQLKYSDGLEKSSEVVFNGSLYLAIPVKEKTFTVSLLSPEVRPITLKVRTLGIKDSIVDPGSLTTGSFNIPESVSSIFVETDFLGEASYTHSSVDYPCALNKWVSVKSPEIKREEFLSSSLTPIAWGNIKQKTTSKVSNTEKAEMYVGLDQIQIACSRGNKKIGVIYSSVENNDLQTTSYLAVEPGDSTKLISGVDVLFQRDNPHGIYKELVIPVSLNYGNNSQFLVPGNTYTFSINLRCNQDFSVKDCLLNIIQGVIPISEVNNPNYTDALIKAKVSLNGKEITSSRSLSKVYSDGSIDSQFNKFDLNFKKGKNTLSIEILYSDINSSIKNERSLFTNEPYLQVSFYPSPFSDVFSESGVDRYWGGEVLNNISLNSILSDDSTQTSFALDSENGRILLREVDNNLDGRVRGISTKYLYEGSSSEEESLETALTFNFKNIEDRMSKLRVYGR